MSEVTLVTGLWDIKRESLNEGWSRSYEHYLTKFEQLLKIDCNLIIFGDEELKKFVSYRRDDRNTQFITRDKSWFSNNDYYQKIQNIRSNPKWYNQSGWLVDSTQAKLELYNPLVMSKMFLLHDALLISKFNTEYLYWIDAGLTNTVHSGYFTHDKVIDKIPKLFNKFGFICFPYDGKVEIHGFEYNKMCELSNTSDVNRVARGGFFGGKKEYIQQSNSIYYSLLMETLNSGYMGTEESIFTIMTYRHPEIFTYAEIESNGLVGKFFEDVKTDSVEMKYEKPNKQANKPSVEIDKYCDASGGNVGLYVLTYNSPSQFKTLIESMKLYDSNFLDKPKKYLLNNSTDLSTTEEYIKLCEDNGFEHIKKDNLGICGGRQFISEHSNEHGFDFHIFFEDDMFFYNGKDNVCRCGFQRIIPNLYNKILQIMNMYKFDFLKLNYSEFFGDNGTQWSWYNVPQLFREKHWPNNRKLPEIGLDDNAPKTKIQHILTHSSVSFATGEIYYCNWPTIISKEGNRKMFIDVKFQNPYEQTWMSHIFQETIKGNIKPAILMATVTEHNRFEHYDSKLRKEC